MLRGPNQLNNPNSAELLENGHTPITDSNNNRVVEVDAHDHLVWQYVTNTQKGSNSAPLPTRAIRTRDGKTIISDQFNDRVIIVDMDGNIVASFGNLNAPGFGKTNASEGLNAPYDANASATIRA